MNPVIVVELELDELKVVLAAAISQVINMEAALSCALSEGEREAVGRLVPGLKSACQRLRSALERAS